MRARLYSPARTAMSSGMAKTKSWVLVFEPASPAEVDPLMGWTSSGDTQQQVRLSFETRKAAEAYAQAHDVQVEVCTPNQRKPNIRPGGYGENFATNRRRAWTH